MSWFRVDDQWHAHGKVVVTSLAARGLWVSAGSWCSRNSPDGKIPPQVLKMFGATKRHANELVSSGLWEKVDGGWRFHDWADYLPKTTEQKEANARRQKEFRERERERIAREESERDALRDALRDGERDGERDALRDADETRSPRARGNFVPDPVPDPELQPAGCNGRRACRAFSEAPGAGWFGAYTGSPDEFDDIARICDQHGVALDEAAAKFWEIRPRLDKIKHVQPRHFAKLLGSIVAELKGDGGAVEAALAEWVRPPAVDAAPPPADLLGRVNR